MNCDLWQENEPKGVHFPSATLLDNGCVVVHWAKGKHFELEYEIVVCDFNNTRNGLVSLDACLDSVLVSAAPETEGWETCSPQVPCFSYSTVIQNLCTVYFLTYPI